MAKGTGQELNLDGDGAAYLRVSRDNQETQRQIESIRAFEERHGVKIAPRYWYEDTGWERDADKIRPEFNKLLEQVRRGAIQWIVVDRLDRFGAKSPGRLLGYLADLTDLGCRLFDVSGKEWTGIDDATLITALIGGSTSNKEQREKSYRALGGMVSKAKAGEWQGGPVKLGFDVGCFDRATNVELWRVVFEGREAHGSEIRRGKARPVYRILRSKVHPDGRTERFDGTVVYKTSPDTEVMRIVPTRDTAKLEAVRGLFQRYATEAVSYFHLAVWLNGLGLRNAFGNKFQGGDVTKILQDEAYLGYATFSKVRVGRFHRHDAEGGITELEGELKGRQTECDPLDVIRSPRLFEPLVDRATWDAVQRKMREKKRPGTTSRHTPKNPAMYLAGLVVCSGCGKRMSALTEKREYHCAEWDKYQSRGALKECPCERNGVKQALIEMFLNRYLEESGKRLDLLTRSPNSDKLTENLKRREVAEWEGFREGISRLTTYLAEHHADEYNAILQEHSLPQEEGGPGPDDFVDAVVRCYKTNFNPAEVTAEVQRLDAEHSALTEKWADLPTPLAKAKAKERLATLEARIEELRKQEEDASEVVAAHYTEMHDLQTAIAKAKIAMKSETGASALRQRAEALRGIISRIECEFVVVVPVKRAGKRTKRYQLVSVTIYPITGPSERVEIGGGDPVGSGGCVWTNYPDLSARPNLSALLRIRYTV